MTDTVLDPLMIAWPEALDALIPERVGLPGIGELFAESGVIRHSVKERPATPLVVSCPHSGSYYPDDLLAASHLPMAALRSSEDAFVDDLFLGTTAVGGQFVEAKFPRVYVDPNRAPFELDPALFAGPLPEFATTRNARIDAGLGTVARVVSNAVQIYRGKVELSMGLRRIRDCWLPYHQALIQAIQNARAAFGYCLLVDAHSMPSSIRHIDKLGRALPIAEIVLGDNHGASCVQELTNLTAHHFRAYGYRTACNNPYAGGYITAHYGRPDQHIHALQIEINRALYMDEQRFRRVEGFDRLQDTITTLLEDLASLKLPVGGTGFPLAAE